MAFHLFNTPPLKGHAPKRVPSVREKDIELFSMELRAMKWEGCESEWSRGWGKLFTDLYREVNTLQKCLDEVK